MGIYQNFTQLDNFAPNPTEDDASARSPPADAGVFPVASMAAPSPLGVGASGALSDPISSGVTLRAVAGVAAATLGAVAGIGADADALGVTLGFFPTSSTVLAGALRAGALAAGRPVIKLSAVGGSMPGGFTPNW